MKKEIHPNYKESTIVCACGETIHTRSTKASIKVDICSQCHPFFTGKQKFVDSAGRVDKYVKKFANIKPKAKKDKSKNEAPETENKAEQAQS